MTEIQRIKDLRAAREKLKFAGDYVTRSQDILLPNFSDQKFLTSQVKSCIISLETAMQEIDRLVAFEAARLYPQEDDGYYEPLPQEVKAS